MIKKHAFLIIFFACLLCCNSTSGFTASGMAVQVGAGPYAVSELARLNGFQAFWDPLAKSIRLENARHQYALYAGSSLVLKDGQILDILEKPVLGEGTLWISAPGAERLGLSLSTEFSMVYSEPVSLSESSLPKRASAKPLRVIVDAGHGGKDSGAVSPHGVQEKDIVLEVAKMVAERLESWGCSVKLTRASDIFIPLKDRAEIANRFESDFFISIHANASTSRSLNGFEIYTLSEATDDQALALERAENATLRFEVDAQVYPTRHLKTILWDLRQTQNRKDSIQAAEAVASQVVSAVPVAAKRIKTANFYVIKWTQSPAMLVEIGYLSNASDERRLRSPAYRRRMAEAIAEGFMKFGREFSTANSEKK